MNTNHLPRVWDDDIDEWDEDCRIYKGEYFTGIAYLTYDNGQIESEGLYIEGLPEGSHKDWYENGQMKKESIFTRNCGSLLSREWYENGQIKNEVQCLYGFIQEEKEWDENGILTFKTVHDLTENTLAAITRRRERYRKSRLEFYKKYNLGVVPLILP